MKSEADTEACAMEALRSIRVTLEDSAVKAAAGGAEMTFQKRLKRVMRWRGYRVADLARELGRPYTTVREWVENGRLPEDLSEIEDQLILLEAA